MAWNNGGGNQQQGGKQKYQHKENRGSIFDNDHKTTEKHPDFTGSANINGVVYWVSGWAEMKNNKRMLSLAFKPQDEKPSDPRPSQTQTTTGRRGW